MCLPFGEVGPFEYAEGFSSWMIQPKLLTQTEVVVEGNILPVVVAMDVNNEAVTHANSVLV